MKKYFMQETAEELKFGDMIVLDLSKEMENGHTKHHHLECKFIPELVPILLEEGVIKEEEVEDETPLDFQDEDENELYALLKEMIKANEKLELRVDKLEKTVIALRQTVASLAAKDVVNNKSQKNASKQNRK
jgi:hypothetical protein